MDTIADLLTRIRNASAAKHEKVDVPHSALKEGVVDVLKEKGFVSHYRVVRDNKQGMMRVYLKYEDGGRPVLSHLKRESRPGRRQYLKVTEIPIVRTGYGLAVISTSQGVMSGEEAREKKLGGEYICSIW